jgi:membrane protein required for colicin V production
MNWIDIIILILLGLAVALGFKKGLVQEIVGIIGLIVSFFLALKLHPAAAGGLLKMFRNIPPHLAPTIGFVIMFLACFGAITLAGWLLSKIIKATPLDLADKVGGMVIGLVKGAVIISILLLLLTFLPLSREMNQKLDRSGMIRSMRKVAPWVYEKTKGLWPRAKELYKEFEKTPEPKKVEEMKTI